MVATYTVKINGVLYKAGDELPCLDSSKKKNTIVEDIKEEVIEQPTEETEEVEEVVEKPKRTRKTK